VEVLRTTRRPFSSESTRKRRAVPAPGQRAPGAEANGHRPHSPGVVTLTRSQAASPRITTAALALLVHLAVNVLVWAAVGPKGWFFACLLPFTIASAAGAYLFFVQHNFPDVHLRRGEDWAFDRAALEASSFLKLGPVLNWFTANIGYHHVHHLNARIPFYRLPEAMAAIPEAQSPRVTTLRLRDMVGCLRLHLWDPERQRLVPYREAAGAKAPAA